MQLLSSRNTELGIREIRRRKAETQLAGELTAELAGMMRRIEVMQAKVDAMSKPARPENPWAAYPVVRSTFQRIEARACKVFRVKRGELYSERRNREITLARHFVMYWACRMTRLSLPQIGRLMGGRDHTTVLHGKLVYPEKRAKMGRTLRKVR